MTINEMQDEVIAEFSDFDDWMDRYQLLIDLGNEQQPPCGCRPTKWTAKSSSRPKATP